MRILYKKAQNPLQNIQAHVRPTELPLQMGYASSAYQFVEGLQPKHCRQIWLAGVMLQLTGMLLPRRHFVLSMRICRFAFFFLTMASYLISVNPLIYDPKGPLLIVTFAWIKQSIFCGATWCKKSKRYENIFRSMQLKTKTTIS